MFDSWRIKDAKKIKAAKRRNLPDEIIFNYPPEETAWPYFEIIPSAVLSDMRYNTLNGSDKGNFLQLILIMWMERCRLPRHAESNADRLGMGIEEWLAFEERLLAAGLLSLDFKGHYIVQKELREQYLHNRQSHKNRAKRGR